MPIAQTDITQTFPNTPVTIDVLANDSGSNLTIIGLNNPAFGSISLNPDQTLTYTPATDFKGEDSFSYTIRDSFGETAQGLVSLTVAEPNLDPDAVTDTVTVISGRSVSIDVLSNDSDPDQDPIMLVALSAAGHGTVTVNQDQTLRYEAGDGFVGKDSFTYTIGDGRGGFDSTIVRIDVREPNTGPEAADDSVQTNKNTEVTFDALANDTDIDGDNLLLTSISFPIFGTLAVNGDFSFTYTPNTDFVGQDSFTYQISDGRGGVSSALVAIDVTESNQPPVAANDNSIEVFPDDPFTIDVLGNDVDPDGDELVITGVTMPNHGTVAINGDKTLTYRSEVGYLGTDSFTYTISDERSGESTATVSINVVEDPSSTTFVNGYDYRRRFIIGAGTISGTADLTDFPLLVEERGDWLRSTANGGQIQDGTHLDMRFETIDGVKLDHEIESYDAAAGELIAWVRLPVVSASETTEFYLYYGKPTVSFDESNSRGVWRDYLAVYHFPDGIDRTGNGRDLTASNVQSDVLIGQAGRLDGISSVLNSGDASWLSGLDGLTAQMWVKSDETDSDRGFLSVGAIDGQDNSQGFGMRYDAVGYSGGGNNVITLEQGFTDGRTRIESSSDIQTTDRQAIALAWQAGGMPRLYVDGLESAPTWANEIARSGPTDFGGGPLTIGAGAKDSASGGWKGLIDEVRFRAEALSASWLAAEHASQLDPQTFYGMSGEQASSSGDPEAPVALADRAETDQDMAVDIDVLANDVDVSGSGGLTIVSVDTPANGTASVNGGLITYTPASGFSGEDRFSYLMSDGAKTSRGYVVVSVRAVSSATGGAVNDDLPYSGLFYGCAVAGVTPSNWRYTSRYSQRFRCERTGSVNKIRWWNKYDTREGYHTGDGGVIRVEIQADNGNGHPTGAALGKSADIEAPVNIGIMPLIDIAPAVQLTKGERYHIVYHQLDSSRGTISVNENYTYVADTPLAPWYGDDLASLKPSGSSWAERHGHHGVFELHYTDGIVKGQGFMMGYRSDRRFISGGERIRQRFVIEDVPKIAKGLYFRLYRTSTTGRDLTMQLKNGSGTVMESLVIPESQIALDPYNDSRNSRDAGIVVPWLKRDFANQHSFSVGQTYYLELSAPSGASYAIMPQQDGSGAWGYSEDKLRPRNLTRAEYSTDGGSSWRGAKFFTTDNRSDLDYPFLLELVP